MHDQLEKLRLENTGLTKQVHELSKGRPREQPSDSASGSDYGQSSSDSSNDNESDGRRSRSRRPATKQLYPPGFREVRSRVKCFSGNKGEDDFQLWLEDFKEASNDCQWSDDDRARWFS